LWRNADVIMCHGYKLASLNWCCQLLPCSDGEKRSLMTNSRSFRPTVAATKREKQSHLRVWRESWTFACSSKHTELARRLSNMRTWNQAIRNPKRIAWFHVLMLLSADKMNIFHRRTRLSSPSKLGSNWQHQLRLASLYPWHIMTSALRHN